jgi:hypothetical protein
MANTYNLISSNVLSSSAGSVTFSSIPSTYKDLVLRFSARRDSDAAWIRFNGVATTSYSYNDLQGLGSVTNASENNYSYFIIYGGANSSSDQASTFSSVEVYIPNYADTQVRTYFCSMVRENNTTTSAGSAVGGSAGAFSSTTAISSLSITAFNGGTFDADSSFYLYGIKNT